MTSVVTWEFSNGAKPLIQMRLRKHVFTIWTLTHYETSLWRRVLKIRVKAMVKDHPIIRVKGFVVLNGHLLVFATEKKVYGCSLTDMRIQEICDHECEFNVLRFTSYNVALELELCLFLCTRVALELELCLFLHTSSVVSFC
ncbi:hypothetical protein HKD37_03G007098 [Glycine soja]|uniref:Uncharacterized protein n=1 Tax=Glycine soja TaxID=3848 RepID=A0A445L9K7_GLYSO|nr:hypothetical protein GmHk_03G007101 [Glycine max]RZC19594.1 hypothetical protein D0Y65_006432 [Glycine soja]